MQWIIPTPDDKRDSINLCNGELEIQAYFETPEEYFEDNVELYLSENCPEDQALLRATAVSIGMTSEEARKLAKMLLGAADENDAFLANMGKQLIHPEPSGEPMGHPDNPL